MALLWRIERFLREQDMRPTAFGKRAVNDPRLVFDMRRGREPRPATRARIEAYLDGGGRRRAGGAGRTRARC